MVLQCISLRVIFDARTRLPTDKGSGANSVSVYVEAEDLMYEVEARSPSSQKKLQH